MILLFDISYAIASDYVNTLKFFTAILAQNNGNQKELYELNHIQDGSSVQLISTIIIYAKNRHLKTDCALEKAQG